MPQTPVRWPSKAVASSEIADFDGLGRPSYLTDPRFETKPSRRMKSGILLLLLLVGCGTASNDSAAHLAGTITINGEPLPADAEGYIQFMPSQGGQAAPASTDVTDSQYDAQNVPKGKVTVIFNITRLTGRMVREDNVPTASPYPERENLVPRKHRSGLQIDVKGDNDAMDFEL